MKINVKRLTTSAIIPKYQTEGAACFDLHSDNALNEFVCEYPVFNTGLSFEIPEGHVMLIFSRSGHGFNHAVRLSNCVGVIDSDYRGEVKVKLHEDDGGNQERLLVKHGDRIAQAMIIPVTQVSFTEVPVLGTTVRGVNGFGSTGYEL